jgi:hypothetical protein
LAKGKADREEVTARLGAIHDKTDANQMRLEPDTEHQKKMDASLTEIKEDIETNQAIRAETKSIQAKSDADREHMLELMATNQTKIETMMDAIQQKKDANLREIICKGKR